MAFETNASWWQRLLLGLLALVITLTIMIAVVVVRDFRREPDLQWFNGGEIQVVGYLGIMDGIACLATYILFVAPLVLLWPAWSQRKHWYAILAVAMLWPPIAILMLHWQNPSLALHEFVHFSGILLLPELFAIFSCGIYLLLIRWRGNTGQGSNTASKTADNSAI